MIVDIILLLTVASWIYWLVALWLVYAFFHWKAEIDLDYQPPVSILKPVKGLDAGAYENFASFCNQDYPTYEILFGVADLDDPVIPVINRLRQDFPDVSIRLIVGYVVGTNRKAGLLHMLTGRSRYDVLAVSDSDMRVTPDYLSRVVAPLADPEIGLVTCPYRGERPVTFTARLEALHMGVTFLPSVLVAREFLNMRFAMGATNVLRRKDLARLGGFAAIADYLADDYQLGVHITRLGLRVHLSDYIVNSILGATTFREQWHREVRWAHCNRISRPMEYPGLLLSFSTPLAAILLVLSGFASWGWAVFGGSLLLRWAVGWLVAGLTKDDVSRRWLFWLPVRDMLSALIWCAGSVGRHIYWRGEKFLLRPDGRLKPVARYQNIKDMPMILNKAVRKLDALLRHFYQIFEFDQDENCLLRMSIEQSDRELTLSGGTHIELGDMIGELHFWNEHMPQMPKGGPNMAWALTFRRQITSSLKALAVYVESDPQSKSIKAFRGNPPFVGSEGMEPFMEMLERWGFDVKTYDRPAGVWGRFVSFWQRFYTILLIWAYNPGSLNTGNLWERNRDQLWISRDVLIKKYAAEKKPVVQADKGVQLDQVDFPDLHRRPTH